MQGVHGRRETWASVKASAEQRQQLASSTVLTPVRRTTRKSVTGVASQPLASQLETSHWAYSPNVALASQQVGESAGGERDDVDVEALMRSMHTLGLRGHGEAE
jgi:predicted glutamine amidotransferase